MLAPIEAEIPCKVLGRCRRSLARPAGDGRRGAWRAHCRRLRCAEQDHAAHLCRQCFGVVMPGFAQRLLRHPLCGRSKCSAENCSCVSLLRKRAAGAGVSGVDTAAVPRSAYSYHPRQVFQDLTPRLPQTPGLQVHIMIDYLRGHRRDKNDGSSSVGLLSPLVEAFPDQYVLTCFCICSCLTHRLYVKG